MAQKNVREIIAEIRKGNIAPVYILMGEEAYFIDLIVENLEAFAVDEADKDFNYNVERREKVAIVRQDGPGTHCQGKCTLRTDL